MFASLTPVLSLSCCHTRNLHLLFAGYGPRFSTFMTTFTALLHRETTVSLTPFPVRISTGNVIIALILRHKKRAVDFRDNFCISLRRQNVVATTLAILHCAKSGRAAHSRFCGECEIRTHGSLRDRRFSKPLP